MLFLTIKYVSDTSANVSSYFNLFFKLVMVDQISCIVWVLF
jgi:hypothetical protein